MKITRDKLSTAAAVAIYPVRLVQLGCIVVTGFAVGFLVWMHENHYCADYSCSRTRQDVTSVPIGEVLLITASVLVTLEWILFSSNLAFRAHTGKPALVNTATQFACACFALFVYSIGLIAFASIPTVHATWPVCYDIWYNSVFDPPEKYFCILTQSAVTCGLITWIGTLVVALLNLVEFRKNMSVGAIRLGDDTRLPTDADEVSIRDVAVNSSS